jgi:hypothetical protein
MWQLLIFVTPFVVYICGSILGKIYRNERQICDQLYAQQAELERRKVQLMMDQCRRIIEDEQNATATFEIIEPEAIEVKKEDIFAHKDISIDSTSSDEALEDVNRKHLVSKLKNFFEKNISKLNRAIEPIKIKRKKKSSESVATTAKEPSSTANIRFRNKIRRGDDFENVLKAQRFSRRFSQYSISEYLDEKEPLRSVSISDLLADDQASTEPAIHPSFDHLELKASTPKATRPISFDTIEPTDSGRGSADTFEQIFEEQTFSRGCSQYSISDLLDDPCEKCLK